MWREKKEPSRPQAGDWRVVQDRHTGAYAAECYLPLFVSPFIGAAYYWRRDPTSFDGLVEAAAWVEAEIAGDRVVREWPL